MPAGVIINHSTATGVNNNSCDRPSTGSPVQVSSAKEVLFAWNLAEALRFPGRLMSNELLRIARNLT